MRIPILLLVGFSQFALSHYPYRNGISMLVRLLRFEKDLRLLAEDRREEHTEEWKPWNEKHRDKEKYVSKNAFLYEPELMESDQVDTMPYVAKVLKRVVEWCIGNYRPGFLMTETQTWFAGDDKKKQNKKRSMLGENAEPMITNNDQSHDDSQNEQMTADDDYNCQVTLGGKHLYKVHQKRKVKLDKHFHHNWRCYVRHSASNQRAVVIAYCKNTNKVNCCSKLAVTEEKTQLKLTKCLAEDEFKRSVFKGTCREQFVLLYNAKARGDYLTNCESHFKVNESSSKVANVSVQHAPQVSIKRV